MKNPLEILVIEPYYGGSYRSFLENLRSLPFNFKFLTLPARKWKWIFDLSRERLKHRIIHFGYAESHKAYAALLRKRDIAVSTANHEFFGMAVLEAVHAGCRLLLPRRLSCPELFPEEYLYDDGGLFRGLRKLILEQRRFDGNTARRLTEPYSWSNVSARLQQRLETATVA